MRIHVPHEGSIFPSQTDALVFEVQGIIYRSLIDLIKAANEDNVASSFHYVPHKLYCRHPMQQADHIYLSLSNTLNQPLQYEETRLYGEAYVCDAILAEDAHI